MTALILAPQPLLTAAIASRWMHERLAPAQWTGVAVGLAGVALVVWHKFDIRDLTPAGLVSVMIGLAGVTAGTLYQRAFCPHVNLWSGAFLQFGCRSRCWPRSPGRSRTRKSTGAGVSPARSSSWSSSPRSSP